MIMGIDCSEHCVKRLVNKTVLSTVMIHFTLDRFAYIVTHCAKRLVNETVLSIVLIHFTPDRFTLTGVDCSDHRYRMF